MEVILRVKAQEKEGVEMAPTEEEVVADTIITMVVPLIRITLHIKVKLTLSLEISLLELIIIVLCARFVARLVILH